MRGIHLQKETPMTLSWIDIGIFLAFIGGVVGISLYKSRQKKETSEDYFLASRNLMWYLIGFSLIASNISTEQFVGMSGQSAGQVGMAVASYEWIAAITLVIVAIFFLPKFLKSGIFTIPEYLEHRFSPVPRAIMAFYTVVILRRCHHCGRPKASHPLYRCISRNHGVPAL